MSEKNMLKITEKDGTEKEYEIIMLFKWSKTKKNYIIYTDNTVDDEDNLRVLAAIYYPENNGKLEPVETEEEWDEIENRLNNK